MFWSLTFQLLPDEAIIEDSTKKDTSPIKPAYSVFLTNRRAIFRFDGLGSSMTQSFFYDEITDVRPSKRLFFSYLLIITEKKEYLLNTSNAEYWSSRISEIGSNLARLKKESRQSPERKKRELLDMLTVLRKNSLLTDEELDEKVRLLDSLKF